MEFDSLPDLISKGIIRDCTPDWRWIFTLAVTSIFPFNPNLGDQMFSSMSKISSISIFEEESCVFSSLDLGRKLSQKVQFPLILNIKVCFNSLLFSEQLHSKTFCFLKKCNDIYWKVAFYSDLPFHWDFNTLWLQPLTARSHKQELSSSWISPFLR